MNIRGTIITLLALGFCLTGCASGDKHVQARGDIIEVVRSHIAKEKRWPERNYKIEVTKRLTSSGHRIVEVEHKDDAKLAIPGGGKSVQPPCPQAGNCCETG